MGIGKNRDDVPDSDTYTRALTSFTVQIPYMNMNVNSMFLMYRNENNGIKMSWSKKNFQWVSHISSVFQAGRVNPNLTAAYFIRH